MATERPPRSRLRLRDLLSEAAAGILQRPLRSALTMIGTVLGMAAFVAIAGLTATANGQISKEFTVLAATEVTVTADTTGDTANVPPTRAFPDDSRARITRLNGVTDAGLTWRVRLGGQSITNTPSAATPPGASALTMTAADPGALSVAGPRLDRGRLYDQFAQHRAAQVAVLGPAAAQALGITSLHTHPAVFVGDQAFTVIGILADVQRHPELLSSVIIPTSTALEQFGIPVSPPAGMWINTDLGAAPLVAKQAALALRPDAPDQFTVTAPEPPTRLKGAVDAQMHLLLLLLAGISLIIGAFGIANTTLVAVAERTPEIGLRRALGARRRHIVAQFLTESTTLGTIGGLVGASIGAAIVVLVALVNDWTAILSPWIVLPAPLVGSVIGLLAGLYPAQRAAWVEPIAALRH